MRAGKKRWVLQFFMVCCLLGIFLLPVQAAGKSSESEKKDNEVTSITMEKTKSLRVNQTVTLRTTVLPTAAAAREKLSWSSSNEAVASVRNGRVTGCSAGEAMITVRSASGKQAFCKVTVGITKTTYFESFAKATYALVMANKTDKNLNAAAGNRFFAKRLIVKTNGRALDVSKLTASAVVNGTNGLDIVQLATVPATESAMKTISQWSGIEFVEPDRLVQADGAKSQGSELRNPGDRLILNGPGTVEDTSDKTGSAGFEPNITDVSYSTALDAAGLGTASFNSWGVKRIGADAYAKRIAERTSASIKVAVVDSGVDHTHPFLKSRVTSDGYDFVDNDSNAYDLFGHGTHVAGTIVDCTPGLNVKILPVRVLDSDGTGWNSVISCGIYYAVERGAKVINMSINGDCSEDEEGAIDYAVQKGVTVVVSAGNKNHDVVRNNNCPAHKKNVICVGAIDSGNVKADFSNYGSTLDVVAPGVGIYSCVPGGYYESWDGTSMATPHVAALAAMIKLLNPSMSPAQIENAIKNRCKDLGSAGWDKYYGYGIPNFTTSKTIAVTKVTLNKTAVSVEVGGKYTLKATVSPTNATNKKITWSSSNTGVATVSGGVVTTKKVGTAVITAKASNGKKATCKVTVTTVAKPAVPTFTYGFMNEDGKIDLGWTAINGAAGYRITIYNFATGTTGVRHITSRTKTDWSASLNRNVLYRLSVCAYKLQNGTKIYGDARFVHASAPRLIQSVNVTSTARTLKWTKLTGISGYYVYRSNSSNSGYKMIKKLPATATSVRITGLGSGTTYIRVIPYKIVNGKDWMLPYKTTVIK